MGGKCCVPAKSRGGGREEVAVEQSERSPSLGQLKEAEGAKEAAGEGPVEKSNSAPTTTTTPGVAPGLPLTAGGAREGSTDKLTTAMGLECTDSPGAGASMKSGSQSKLSDRPATGSDAKGKDLAESGPGKKAAEVEVASESSSMVSDSSHPDYPLSASSSGSRAPPKYLAKSSRRSSRPPLDEDKDSQRSDPASADPDAVSSRKATNKKNKKSKKSKKAKARAARKASRAKSTGKRGSSASKKETAEKDSSKKEKKGAEKKEKKDATKTTSKAKSKEPEGKAAKKKGKSEPAGKTVGKQQSGEKSQRQAPPPTSAPPPANTTLKA